MTGLIALGAGVAVVTGIEQVLVSAWPRPRQWTLLQDSLRQTARLQRHFC